MFYGPCVFNILFVNVVVFGIFFHSIMYCNGERRITNGKLVKEHKRYMAYLLKAPLSSQKYDAWLCGGAIVSPLYIVTSAACIEDVQHMYAIAGYNKYVRSQYIDTNECTKNKKKKIVYTCVPKAYDLIYEKVEKWSYIDIGVVKVESSFDFADKSYESLCTYTPNQIPINYESKYQEPGTDAVVLGWGHSEVWRKPSDQTDYNQPELHYAATLLTDKEECKQSYSQIPKMKDTIEKYMICTNQAGNIDDGGELIVKTKPVGNGCVVTVNENHTELIECVDSIRIDGTRKQLNVNGTNIISRRHGICQNDHGGPLVTWVGSHEILIGVASVFRVNNDSKCEGPYLFTSTQCNGAFLDCIINGENSRRRRSICDVPPQERGFEFINRRISWTNHPDGIPGARKIGSEFYCIANKGFINVPDRGQLTAKGSDFGRNYQLEVNEQVKDNSSSELII